MKRTNRRRIAVWFLAVSLSTLFTVSSYAGTEKPEHVAQTTVTVGGMQPAMLQAEAKPGLAVLYYVDFFKRDLRKLPTGNSPEYPSFHGKPVLQLDHAFGRGEVFASGRSQGVGMRMTGYLHFQQTGTYILQAESNDGIIMEIDNKVVLSDPKQHSDRLSERAEVVIGEPGWYPVKIAYFQRKGTATLRLLWQEPGGKEMAAVPAEVYAHVPGS